MAGSMKQGALTLGAWCMSFFALWNSARAVQNDTLFLRRQTMDDFLGDTYYSSTAARNRALCSLTCLGEPSCLSLTFDAATKTCFFYDTYAPPQGSPRPGAVTFYRWNKCPSDWTLLVNNLCVKLSADKLTKELASRRCSQLGGHLATVPTQQEVTWLLSILDDQHAYVWLGGSDLEVEGQWQWEDTKEAITQGWIFGEPNSDGGEEDCLTISRYHGGLNDYSCSPSLRYICEIPL